MKRRSPRPLADALAGLTGSLEPSTTLARVQRVWPEVVGAKVASAALPTAEREGVLRVTCSDAVWAAELEMMPELVARLNAALGGQAVVRLSCRVG